MAFVFATQTVRSIFFNFELAAVLFNCTDKFVSNLIGNPKDQFSCMVAPLVPWQQHIQGPHIGHMIAPVHFAGITASIV